MQPRFPLYLFPAALFLLTLPYSLHAGSPIVIGDGSVCVEDGQTDLPADASHQHERPFNLLRIVYSRVAGSRECEPVLDCPQGSNEKTCRTFPATTKDVVVEYQEAGTRFLLTATFANGTVRLTSVGRPFRDWGAIGNSRRRRRRPNANFQGIFVDGERFQCTKPCRITLVEQ